MMRLSRFLLATNTELHKKMLASLIRARVLFFDINPIGRVLNRFSNDLGILDKGNLISLLDVTNGTVEVLSLVLTVCAINPFVTLPAIIVMYLLFNTKRFFNKALILSKDLDLTTRSPMFSAVSSTLHGLIIVRTYQQGGRFIKDFMNMVYNSARAYLFLAKANRLLAVMLDSAINSLTVISIMTFAVTLLYYRLEAGLLGLSLLSLLRFGDKSNYTIRQTMYVDINMQSTQRMLNYCQLPSEAPESIPSKDNAVEARKWPTKGDIVFKDVYLRYRDDLRFALNGLSFTIKGGSKVACVGRTGAGKSSILQALFRMVEIEEGADYSESFIKIDAVDTRSIGLNLLRRSLSIIPQTPVVFTGTIRRNLDPFGVTSDTDLWYSLEEVGLKQYVMSLEKQLETDMTVSASIFSAGQKQLMCLARAILMKNKIIVLDEATANVDIETDNFIQKKIIEKFADCTVVTIAHRLITIAHYDSVVVMDNGKMVEYDSPYALLTEKIGDSRITKHDGLFADMVKSTGKNMSKKIFEVAREAFYKKFNKKQ